MKRLWEVRYHPLGPRSGYFTDEERDEMIGTFCGTYIEWRQVYR